MKAIKKLTFLLSILILASSVFAQSNQRLRVFSDDYKVFLEEINSFMHEVEQGGQKAYELKKVDPKEMRLSLVKLRRELRDNKIDEKGRERLNEGRSDEEIPAKTTLAWRAEAATLRVQLKEAQARAQTTLDALEDARKETAAEIGKGVHWSVSQSTAASVAQDRS